MKAPRLGAVAVLVGGLACQAAAVEIHPAGPTVPENLLRIELRYGSPQPLPFDLGRVKLLNAAGVELEHALLDLALPSADARRITVLLDPGRVKRGAGPNVDAGRALKAGDAVRLWVAPDRAGQAPTVRHWRVSPAVSQRLAPSTWRLVAPQVGTRDVLVVDLGGPISAFGDALIAVVDAAGRPVRGQRRLVQGDAVWRFTPSRPWGSGLHGLRVHPDLEDPAGNRRCAAFEEPNQSAVRCDEGGRIDFTPTRNR